MELTHRELRREVQRIIREKLKLNDAIFIRLDEVTGPRYTLEERPPGVTPRGTYDVKGTLGELGFYLEFKTQIYEEDLMFKFPEKISSPER